MSSKTRVGILFGGKSAEHEVSLQSAKNIVDAIDRDKYNIVLIGIDKDGTWHLEDTSRALSTGNGQTLSLAEGTDDLALVPGDKSKAMIPLSDRESTSLVDVVFPVLHGPLGEDGTVQGMLKLSGLPFVGAGVLGSAVGMDKDVMKRLLRDAGIPIADYLTFHRMGWRAESFEKVKTKLGLPFFVKPANMGSSVGVHKVCDEADYKPACEDAFQYDRKIIVEEYINGREIECSVLGNDDPIASVLGEVFPEHEFYSYEAKYLDEHGAILQIPADLTSDTVAKTQEMAVAAFKTLCCEGMARVDFFLKENGELVINEINTIPGFTRISMYPKLWEASGLGYSELIDRLIELALERFEQEKQLKTSVDL